MGYSMRTHRYRLTSWFSRGELTDPATTGTTPLDEELYDYLIAPDEPVNLISDGAYTTPRDALKAVMVGDRWDDAKVAQPIGNPAGLEPIAAWKSAYFPLGFGDTGDNADSDHDGLTTAIEYFLGLSPVVPDRGTVTVSIALDGEALDLGLTYPSPVNRPDYTGGAEWSSNLTDWFSSGLLHFEDPATGTSTSTLLTAPPSSFLRISVQPANP